MEKKNIIILGAGFGGVTAALTIARGLNTYADGYEIILVDRHHHQLYTPALYEIASIPRETASEEILKQSILIPLADIAAGRQITLITDEFIGLRPSDKKIILRDAGETAYEFLVMAMGSETNYFDIPGLREHSFPLKTCDDALRLRALIEEKMKKNAAAEIIVGGGGASGVEVAAEFINFFCAIRSSAGKAAKICTAHLTIVEAGPEILAGFDQRMVTKAKKRLNDLGITIRTGARIQSVTENEIMYADGTKSAYDMLVWTGGVKGPVVLHTTDLPLSEKGALVTDEYLRIGQNTNGIFAIGDNAAVVHKTTRHPVVWNVPAARHEASIAAKNILAAVHGKTPTRFAARKKYPFVLALGSKYAIADLGWIRCAGLPGWCIKQLAELRYLLFILPLGKALRIWRLGIRMYASND